MTITITTLTRAAGVAAVVGGCCTSASRLSTPTWTSPLSPRPSGRSARR